MIYTNSQAYEGIFQLRPNNRKVLDYVYGEIERNGTVFITKEVEKKYGIDLYLTNKFFLIQLGRKLRKRFSGKVTQSRALHTRNRQTSKLVYRTTICFRLTKDL